MTAYEAWASNHKFVEYRGHLGKIRLVSGAHGRLLFTTIGGWKKNFGLCWLISMKSQVFIRNLK